LDSNGTWFFKGKLIDGDWFFSQDLEIFFTDVLDFSVGYGSSINQLHTKSSLHISLAQEENFFY